MASFDPSLEDLGYDFNAGVIEGGSDSAGSAALNEQSVLNVTPITSVKKAGLYDPTKPAKAGTAEELYAGRKAAMKAADVRWGTQAYKDWDAQTRALMGVKKGDKFSSGQWMETFSGMKPDEINQAAGNIDYYLNDASFKAGYVNKATPYDKYGHVRSLMDLSTQGRFGDQNIQYVDTAQDFWGGPASLSETTYYENQWNPYSVETGATTFGEPIGTYGTGDITLNPEDLSVKQGYFDDLTAAYPSFRVPSPHGGNRFRSPSSMYSGTTGEWSPVAGSESGQYSETVPAAAFPVADESSEEGGTVVYDAEGNVINRYVDQPTRTGEQVERDALRARQEQLYGSPNYVRQGQWGKYRQTFPGGDDEMFGFQEPLTALPAFYDEETAASFNKRFAGSRYGEVKAGDPFLNPYTPYGDMKPVGNIDLPITGISGGEYKVGEILPQNYLTEGILGEYYSTGTFDPVRRPDMIKILKRSPKSLEIHEKYHGAQRAVAENSAVWKDKVKVGNTPLIDIIRSNWGWDTVAMHAALYAGSQNLLPKEIKSIINHKMFEDIDSDTSLSDAQKYSEKLARAKEISNAMNEAAQLILDSGNIQQRPTDQGIKSDWGSLWKNPGG